MPHRRPLLLPSPSPFPSARRPPNSQRRITILPLMLLPSYTLPHLLLLELEPSVQADYPNARHPNRHPHQSTFQHQEQQWHHSPTLTIMLTTSKLFPPPFLFPFPFPSAPMMPFAFHDGMKLDWLSLTPSKLMSANANGATWGRLSSFIPFPHSLHKHHHRRRHNIRHLAPLEFFFVFLFLVFFSLICEKEGKAQRLMRAWPQGWLPTSRRCKKMPCRCVTSFRSGLEQNHFLRIKLSY